MDLLDQDFIGWVEVLADGVAQVRRGERARAVEPEVDDRLDVVERVDHGALFIVHFVG